MFTPRKTARNLETAADPARPYQKLGAGHNCFGFDLPRLRLAAVRNGLKLPEALRVLVDQDEDRRRFLDTKQHFCRYFGRNGEVMISQEKMLGRLGIESLLKGVATGADVPALLDAGKSFPA